MPVAEVTSRIQQIEGQLAVLSGRSVQGTAKTVGAGSTDFAAALAAADSTTAASDSGAASPLGQQVVDEARKYLGVPYVWGGTDPNKGLDCSGLVQLVYRKLGIDLPRVSGDQAKAGKPVASLADAKPGDILAFGSPVHHVGIYIGNNKMIEAPRPGKDVRVSTVYEKPSAIRRVLPDQAVASTSGTSGVTAGTPYAQMFEQAGRRYGVQPALLAAVAKQESGFNPSAVSKAGAQGIMQLMPSTARSLHVANPMDPAQSIDGAARLLRDLTKQFGRVDLALAAYNAGPGAVHRYNGIPPYAETRKYVPSVLAYRSRLDDA